MVQKIPTAGYAFVVTGTLLSMSLQYLGFLENDMIPDKIYHPSKSNEQGFINEWSGIVIGEKKMEEEKIEQIDLPSFKKKYKVKMRVRNAGKLQPPQFSNAENV